MCLITYSKFIQFCVWWSSISLLDVLIWPYIGKSADSARAPSWVKLYQQNNCGNRELNFIYAEKFFFYVRVLLYKTLLCKTICYYASHIFPCQKFNAAFRDKFLACVTESWNSGHIYLAFRDFVLSNSCNSHGLESTWCPK